jgi:hypothetical protein
MTGNDEPTARRYNDAEVRLLLERAARLQGHAPAPVRQQGLTLAQLEEIAAEAQIDVALLRQAARELEMGAMRPTGTVARLAGAPLRIRAERTLPLELDTDAFGSLLGSISGFTGAEGTSSLIGRTFTWNARAESGRRLEVRASVQKGRTHIAVEERYTELAAGLFGGTLGGVGGGAGIGGGAAIGSALGSVAFAVAFPIAVIGGTYAACRIGYRAYVRRRADRVEGLCERLVQDLTSLHDVGGGQDAHT